MTHPKQKFGLRDLQKSFWSGNVNGRGTLFFQLVVVGEGASEKGLKGGMGTVVQGWRVEVKRTVTGQKLWMEGKGRREDAHRSKEWRGVEGRRIVIEVGS